MNKTIYVHQIPESIRLQIKQDIITTLNNLQLSSDTIQEALKEALNSRLCDLQDLIDINKYLK
jgi:energy-coupling factor transporter ATP-binding protein EcfA2